MLRIFADHHDATVPADVDRMVEATVGRFGTIDILCNNAGGSGGRSGDTATLPLDYWLHTMDLTVTSVFLCSQRAGRVMIAKRYFVQIEVQNQEPKELQEWIKRVDLKKLAGIK